MGRFICWCGGLFRIQCGSSGAKPQPNKYGLYPYQCGKCQRISYKAGNTADVKVPERTH